MSENCKINSIKIFSKITIIEKLKQKIKNVKNCQKFQKKKKSECSKLPKHFKKMVNVKKIQQIIK